MTKINTGGPMNPQDAALLASLTGFTPGPWHLGKRFNSVISSNITGYDDARTVDEYGGHLVCESAKMKQNAALIAAAPDLHRIATEQAAENERLRDALGRIASHRHCCHAYDNDMGHPLRGFDVEDVRIMEYAAKTALGDTRQ